MTREDLASFYEAAACRLLPFCDRGVWGASGYACQAMNGEMLARGDSLKWGSREDENNLQLAIAASDAFGAFLKPTGFDASSKDGWWGRWGGYDADSRIFFHHDRQEARLTALLLMATLARDGQLDGHLK
jgi:hypothetical protein